MKPNWHWAIDVRLDLSELVGLPRELDQDSDVHLALDCQHAVRPREERTSDPGLNDDVLRQCHLTIPSQ